MSAQSALRASDAVERSIRVVASELTCATQALDFVSSDLSPGVGTTAAYECVREDVPHLDEDRPIHADVDAVEEMITSDRLFERVEESLGDSLR